MKESKERVKGEDISLPEIGNIAHLPLGEDEEDGELCPIGEKLERILHGGDDIPEQPPELGGEHDETET